MPAVAHFWGLPNIEQLWIAFGTGQDSRYIPIHAIASALLPQMAKGWLFFHAFTGCDVTSYFTNRGQKSAWKTWLAWPVITDSLSMIGRVSIPEDIILIWNGSLSSCTAGPVMICMSIRHGLHYSHKCHATLRTSLEHKLP